MGTTTEDGESSQQQQQQKQEEQLLRIQEKQTKILGWPTDTLSIDYKDNIVFLLIQYSSYFLVIQDNMIGIYRILLI